MSRDSRSSSTAGLLPETSANAGSSLPPVSEENSHGWGKLDQSTNIDDDSTAPLKLQHHTQHEEIQRVTFEMDPPRPVQKPKTRLPLAIVALLCFFPTGIVAFIQSRRAEECWKRGNPFGAEQSSKSAHFWGTLSCVIGALIIITIVIVILILRYSTDVF